MRGKRFITRLAPPTLTVITVAVATLLIGGVANAAVFPNTTAWQLDATTTIITLAVTPASPATDATTTETLTATISPATADGTVQFTDGRTFLGNGVTVTNGTASTALTLPAGKHTLTALFITTDAAYSGSISNTVDYPIDGNRNHHGNSGGNGGGNLGILGGNGGNLGILGGNGGNLGGILGILGGNGGNLGDHRGILGGSATRRP